MLPDLLNTLNCGTLLSYSLLIIFIILLFYLERNDQMKVKISHVECEPEGSSGRRSEGQTTTLTSGNDDLKEFASAGGKETERE